jgi:hypothetical protein
LLWGVNPIACDGRTEQVSHRKIMNTPQDGGKKAEGPIIDAEVVDEKKAA